MADLTSPPDRTPPRDEFFARAYAELRALAESVLGSDPAGRSLGPTALLHEAYLKFKPGEPGRDRAYYFAAAARAMRQVLTDRARKHAALRHGGAWGRVSLTGIDPASPPAEGEMLAVSDLLEALERADARAASVAELHYFGGLALDDIASMLGIAHITARRDWDYARAWLLERLLDPGTRDG